MPKSVFQVVRYSRHEFEQHEDPVSEDVVVGQLLERGAGGELAPYSGDGERPDRLLIAIGARGRGMQLHPDYDYEHSVYDPENNQYAKYIAPSNGGFTLWLAEGETVERGDYLVPDGNGHLRAAAGDGSEDGEVTFQADEDVDATGGLSLIDTDVANN